MSDRLDDRGGRKINDEGIFPPAAAVLLSPNRISRFQQQLACDSILLERIRSDNQEIKLHQKRWADYSRETYGDQESMTLVEFLKRERLVERNHRFEKKIWSRRWHESVKWSGDPEESFVETAAGLVSGQYIEILQIALEKDGCIVYKDATLGGGLEVSGKDADKLIRELPLTQVQPDTVYITHNHYDEYSDLTVPANNYEGNPGLVIVGGLSKQDIEFADEMWRGMLFKRSMVVMTAINDRGLTYAYQAGTSKYRDWENEP